MSWGRGIFQPGFGSSGITQPVLADAVGPEVAGQGRIAYLVDAARPALGSIGYITLLVGATHDGTALTVPADVRYLRYTPGTGSPVPLVRPYHTRAGRDALRWGTSSWVVADVETVAGPHHAIDAVQLWRSLFDGRPRQDASQAVVGTPAAGATSITVSGIAAVSPVAWDAWDLRTNGAPAHVLTGRIGTDPVRYRVTITTTPGGGNVSADITPALQPSTAAELASGRATFTWLPPYEIPVGAPFDLLLDASPATRGTDDGWTVLTAVYWNQYEPRSWYP